MTFILPSFGASAISAVPGSGGGGGASYSNTYSVELDGSNDHITLASSISFSGACTLSTWIKPSCDSDEIFLGYVSTTSFYFYINNEVMFFVPKIGASGISASGFTVSNGSWYNAVIVRDASNNITMYINGVSRATGSYSGALATPGLQHNSYNFTGLVDEYAMWDSDQSSNISSIYNSGVPNDISSLSPLHWWRMGDNDSGSGTTITDQGSGGNDGTLTNGPTFSSDVPVAPPFNTYSVNFDGSDDYMDVGNITAVNSVANASYSFWYKTSATGKVGLLGGGVGTSAYHWSDGTMYVHSWIGTSAHAISIPTLGVWHHIVNTFEASGSKLYVDGSLQSTVDHGDTTATSAGNNFAVGKVPHYNILDGQKLIDEVAFFTSTLSASDVTAIYNSGVPGDLTSYSPVAWWRMGDNDSGTGTTITDQGSGGNDGTLTNGPTFVQGVPSVPAAYSNTYSLDFDGTDDYVSTELSVAGQSELTVSAWVKLDNSSAQRGFVTQYKQNNDRAFRLAYFPNLQSMWFEAYGSGSYAGYKDASITTGTWYHVAGVFSQSSCVVYVNGVASTTTAGLHNSATGNIATCTDNIDIGRMGNADYMDGNIDEVGIWTSALSASDITAIYNSGVPADISSYSPVLYYRMGDNDGGTGTTITDQGSGGNDGTFTNGPTFSTDVPT